jgi:hypothetical protein
MGSELVNQLRPPILLLDRVVDRSSHITTLRPLCDHLVLLLRHGPGRRVPRLCFHHRMPDFKRPGGQSPV